MAGLARSRTDLAVTLDNDCLIQGCLTRVSQRTGERSSRQQLVNRDEIARRLRHLLPLNLQEAVVEPDVGHDRVPKQQRDWAISFSWWGEDEVDAAGVDV